VSAVRTPFYGFDRNDGEFRPNRDNVDALLSAGDSMEPGVRPSHPGSIEIVSARRKQNLFARS